MMPGVDSSLAGESWDGDDAPLGGVAAPHSAQRSPAPGAGDTAGAGGDGAQPEKKMIKRRRKRKLDAPTMAHFMRLQQGRGPVRKWVRKWVAVPSLIGGGETMVLKWVTKQPMAMAAGPSLEQLQDLDTPLPEVPALPSFAATSTASAATAAWRFVDSGAAPAASSVGTPAPAAAVGGVMQQSHQQQQGMAAAAEGEEETATATPVPSAAAVPSGVAAAAAAAEVSAALEAQQQQGGIRGAVAAMAQAAAAAAAAKAAALVPGGASGGAGGASAGKFVCSVCGKAVNSEGGLKKHMLVHGEKNFVCTYPGCGRAFTDQGKLNKHMVVHETEKRWKCPLCAKPFVGEAYLKSHWKKSHKDVPMPVFVEDRGPAGGSVDAGPSAAGAAPEAPTPPGGSAAAAGAAEAPTAAP